MNFEEALKQMERGEKVRRTSWRPQTFCVIKAGDFINEEDKAMRIMPSDCCADNWEIYNPEPALNPCGCGGKAKFLPANEPLPVYACCTNCGIRTEVCEDEEEAARLWNYAHPTPQPKKRTNFEVLFVSWLKKIPESICDYKKAFLFDKHDCGDTDCNECNKRFVEHLQEEYKKEVKDVNR